MEKIFTTRRCHFNNLTQLHQEYCLPAQYFAYVGDANRPTTWKLPYLLKEGGIDTKRLPKAMQAILICCRGARVSSVPEKAIPDVARLLAEAAAAEHDAPSG